MRYQIVAKTRGYWRDIFGPHMEEEMSLLDDRRQSKCLVQVLSNMYESLPDADHGIMLIERPDLKPINEGRVTKGSECDEA